MTLTAGNLRNGATASLPKFMESMDGTYQVGVLIRTTLEPDGYGVTVWKRVLPTVGHPADDRWTYYDLTADAVAQAAGLDQVNPVDDHWDIGVLLDGQNRTWLVGNSHDNISWLGITSLRMIRSDADVINSWHLGITGGYPFSSTGANNHTYNWFERLSDGTCLWFMAQGESLGSSLGRDIIWTHLPPGAGTTWKVPGSPATTGAAHFAISEVDSTGTVANRVYMDGVTVVPAGWYGNANEELHFHGIWRTQDQLASSQQKPFFLYNANVSAYLASSAAGGWRNAAGDSVTANFPVTWFNRADVEIDVAPTRSPNGSAGHAVDRRGQPHMLYRNGVSATDFVHLWYSKSRGAWQSEPLLTGSDPADPQDWSAGGCVARVRNRQMFLASYGGQVRLHNLSDADNSDNDVFFSALGGPAPNGYRAYPEQIAARRHTISVMIPDLNTPKVYDFGNGYRAYKV